MEKLKLTLGCDPEIFLIDPSGVLRSSIGKIGGSKQAPLALVALGDGYAVQEDNVAMEFNVPPADKAEQFVEHIQKCLNYLKDGVQNGYGLTLSNLSAALFPEEELQDPAAQEFGCDPDYNAWTLKMNPRPKAADPRLRSCGGHIHVGYDKKEMSMTSVIRSMDLFLGVPSVLMDQGEMRKELYGAAGAYREQKHGVEYRTLSNFWVLHPRLNQWAFENTQRAVHAVVEQFPVEEDKDAILEAINANNKDVAQSLVEKYKLDVIYV